MLQAWDMSSMMNDCMLVGIAHVWGSRSSFMIYGVGVGATLGLRWRRIFVAASHGVIVIFSCELGRGATGYSIAS